MDLWLFAAVHLCSTYLGTYAGLTMAHRRRDAAARQAFEEMRRQVAERYSGQIVSWTPPTDEGSDV